MVGKGETLTGGASVLFFGFCAGVALWQIFQNRPRLVVSDAGLLDRTLGVGLIRWDDVEDAYVAHINPQPFICLRLRNPEAYLSGPHPARRSLSRASVAMGFTDLSLNLSGRHGADPEALEALIHSQIHTRQSASPRA